MFESAISRLKLSYNRIRQFGAVHLKLQLSLKIVLVLFLFLTLALSFTLDRITPFNYINIGCFAVFCLALLLYIIIYGYVVIDYFILLMAIFLLSQYVATITNLFPYFDKNGTLMVFLTLFVYEFVKQDFITFSKAGRIVFLSSLVLLFAFTIKYFSQIIHPTFSARIGDFFGNQNDVARHLSFSSIISLTCFLTSNKKVLRFLFLIPSALSFYYILLTGSISNILVTLVVTVIVIFLYLKKWKKIVFLFCIAALIALTVILINLPAFSYYKNRIIPIFNSFFGNDYYNVDGSAILRFKGAIFGFKLFLQNPVFGSGYSGVYRNYVIMSHNNIAEIAADFGIVGIISFETILILILLKNKNKQYQYGVLLLMLFIIVFQFFLVTFNDKISNIVIALCASSVCFRKVKILNRVSHYYVNI